MVEVLVLEVDLQALLQMMDDLIGLLKMVDLTAWLTMVVFISSC